MLSLICGIEKQANKQMNIAKQNHRYREQASGYQWGERRGRGKIGD